MCLTNLEVSTFLHSVSYPPFFETKQADFYHETTMCSVNPKSTLGINHSLLGSRDSANNQRCEFSAITFKLHPSQNCSSSTKNMVTPDLSFHV